MRPLVRKSDVVIRSFAITRRARYDAIEKILYLKPAVKGDFRTFVSTAVGYGTVGIKDGKPFCNVVNGKIPFEKIEYTAKSKEQVK